MKAYAQVRGSRSGENSPSQNSSANKAVNGSSNQTKATEGLFAVFALAAFVWLLFAAVLIYHFRRYGKGDGKVQLAQALYIGGSMMLLLIALFAIL